MSEEPLSSGASIGRYELVELLGEGRIARVYRAVDRSLGRPVALKVLSSRLAALDDFKERFLSEARTLAGISYEHVVKVLDCGEEGGKPFVAMELVAGETLKEKLARDPRPKLSFVIKTVHSVLKALNHFHSRGIVHRDVKPANVLLGPGGLVKLVDFGFVTRQDDPRVSSAGIKLPTFRYAAPEVLEGRRPTPQSDLWAVGIIFYELLTGDVPLAELSDAEAQEGMRLGRYPLPSRKRPGLPEELDLIVDRAIDPDPSERFSSAHRFARALEKFRLPSSDAAAPAVPANRPEIVDLTVRRHERKKLRRHHKHRRRYSPVALGLAIGVVGAIFVGVYLNRQRTGRNGLTDPWPSPTVTASTLSPGSPAAVLRKARVALDEAQAFTRRAQTVEAQARAEQAVANLTEIARLIKGRSLMDGLGQEGRLEFLRIVDGADEVIVRSRGQRSAMQELLLSFRSAASSMTNARLDLLDGLVPSEGKTALFWEVVGRCTHRSGWYMSAAVARYQWFECRMATRRGLGPAAIPNDDLTLLLHMEGNLDRHAYFRSAEMIDESFRLPCSWREVWKVVKEGLAGIRGAPAASAAATASETGAHPAVAPVKVTTVAADTAGAEALSEMERIEDEVIQPTPAPSVAGSRAPSRVLRPRAHPQTAPALDRIVKVVADLRGSPRKGTDVDAALTAAASELRKLRSIARVDESAIEFVEPGRPGLFESLRELNELVTPFGVTDQGAVPRPRLMEYVDALKDLGEAVQEDAAHRVISAQACLLVRACRDAEFLFVRALEGSLQHPEGVSPAVGLRGEILEGLVRGCSCRVEFAERFGLRLVGLPGLPLTALDLLRVHTVIQVATAMPDSTKKVWGLDPGFETRVASVARRVGDQLKRAGLGPP